MFPTGVGMNRMAKMAIAGFVSVPHRRGDEPTVSGQHERREVCSPQAWG